MSASADDDKQAPDSRAAVSAWNHHSVKEPNTVPDSGLIVIGIIAVLWLFTARWLAASTRDDCAPPRTLPRCAVKRYGAAMENRPKQPFTLPHLDQHMVNTGR